MKRRNRFFYLSVIGIWLIKLTSISALTPGLADQITKEPGIKDASTTTFLPLITSQRELAPPPEISSSRRINAPYFDVPDLGNRFKEMAIFWFGSVTPTQNYADVRVGYNDTGLFVHLAAFDRQLWNDDSPSPEELEDYDAVTLYLNLTGNSGETPSPNSYKFTGQLYWWGNRAAFQTAYRGNGISWSPAEIPFTAIGGWRGNAPNDNEEDRGWTLTFHIPFASLGLLSPPSTGSLWGMGVVLHDRDDADGSFIADQSWPESLSNNRPESWGQLRFGLPYYNPPPINPTGSTTIRQGINGITVPDAGVGGTTGNLCPGDSYHIWNEWGNWNFAYAPDFNVQNQADVGDWPCFSKYYLTFPLTSLPPNAQIISATLTIYQFGNSGDLSNPDPFWWPYPSLIQVSTVNEDWNIETISWNNAPLALENVSQTWAFPLEDMPEWPGIPNNWDLSYAVAQAHTSRVPLRLALYEADSGYHSGKYFTTSDTSDWNEIGRPTLVVTWGVP